MNDKMIATKLNELTKELNSTLKEAVEINGLQVRVACFPCKKIGTKEQVFYVECHIYKEVT